MSKREDMHPGVPSHRFLVFTSAGDSSNHRMWLDGDRNFDLWITYYGAEPGRYAQDAELYNARKGGKYPNLHFAFMTWPEIFRSYEAIMVMDNDIVIDASGLNALFDIRDQHDLWLLQPAFDPRGKISFPVTRVRPFYLLRFTTYVEMTCPLFRTDKLLDFLSVFEPVMVGIGTDWWFLDTLGPERDGKVAVVDSVPCINPHDRKKGEGREQLLLGSIEEAEILWDEIRTRHGIHSMERGARTLEGIRRFRLKDVGITPVYLRTLIQKGIEQLKQGGPRALARRVRRRLRLGRTNRLEVDPRTWAAEDLSVSSVKSRQSEQAGASGK